LPNDETPAKVVAAGAHLFKDNCGGCHGQDAVARVGGSVPDLRYSTLDVHSNWNDIVIEGNRNVRGMPSFDLEPAEADAIRIYILSLSRQLAMH
jgi:mono/diheme cytochrome c family protein